MRRWRTSSIRRGGTPSSCAGWSSCCGSGDAPGQRQPQLRRARDLLAAAGGVRALRAVGCVLVPLIFARVSDHGVDGLVGGGHNLLPALLFVVLAGGGVVLGTRSLWRQIAASRVLDRRVQALAVALPGELGDAAAAAGLRGRVVLVDSP